MANLSKRKKLIAAKTDATKNYPIEEAVNLLGELAGNTKFQESFDLAVKLGVDTRKSDQAIRGATDLPHGTGKSVRVAVFAAGDLAAQAEDAGADQVGMEDLAEQIKAGKMDFDVVIAAPDAMRMVAPLGPILGPRGLMPNPKVGTVTHEVGRAVKNVKAGQMHYRTDRGGVVHGSVGRVGFSAAAIKENIEAVLTDLKKSKPAAAKGIYFQRIILSTTMGTGLSLDQNSLEL